MSGMQDFKIEFVMKVTSVGQMSKAADGRAFSDVTLRGPAVSATFSNVSEDAARAIAGCIFGKVRITIEPVED